MTKQVVWYKFCGKQVLVIKEDIEKLKTFFEGFGLTFQEEQHILSNGETLGYRHYACETTTGILELYPLPEKSSG